jgi:hypothetical protein
MVLGGRRGCGRVPTTLAGFVPAETRRLALRLGSGHAVSLATRAAPFGQPGRIVAAVLPRGEAVRSAAAIDAGGRTLTRGQLLVAPPNHRCGRDYGYEDWAFDADPPPARRGTPPGTEVAAALAGDGAPRLLVRDAGEQLCVGIDQLDLDGGDCGAPPFSPTHSRFGLHVDPQRGILAGVFPARVTAVEIPFAGGGSARLPALEGVGYTGRNRGTVHFVFAPAPAGKRFQSAILLDATGREVGRAGVEAPGGDLRPVGQPSTVLAAGSVRLVAGAFDTPLDPSKSPCIGIRLGRQRSECRTELAVPEANNVVVHVPCHRRRTVVFGLARRSASRVEVTLSGGRRVRARLAAFPRTLGGRGKVFLAVLDRRAAVTGVRVIDRRRFGKSDTLEMPGRPPAKQCGYESAGQLF